MIAFLSDSVSLSPFLHSAPSTCLEGQKEAYAVSTTWLAAYKSSTCFLFTSESHSSAKRRSSFDEDYEEASENGAGWMDGEKEEEEPQFDVGIG